MKRVAILGSLLSLLPSGCAEKDVDVSQHADAGDSCDPTAGIESETSCHVGLACEPVHGTEDFVCATPLQIRGRVVDANTGEPIEGAHVGGLDEGGGPLADVAVTDVMGHYALDVTAARDTDGELAAGAKWTLIVAASDYQPFPMGVRPALPIDATEREEEPAEGSTREIIENSSTTVTLIPLPPSELAGVTVSGLVADGQGAGTLVVAEGTMPAPTAIADAAGTYTLFNVPAGSHTVRGYRAGLEVESIPIVVDQAPLQDVDLPLVADAPDELGTIRGSVNIVNTPGNPATSVVLVPTSVFNVALERGPVPFGLRVPDPPLAPDVTMGFEMRGVPSGTYTVLAAFENDGLVRDPDESIAGTAIQEITVEFGEEYDLPEQFKITAALDVVSPGADAPEMVSSPPVFTWQDDSSEDRYDLMVFDSRGELVWRDEMVPPGQGGQVEHTYAGPDLEPGSFYQFRATSYRETPQGTFAISRTEDLRGVFVYAP